MKTWLPTSTAGSLPKPSWLAQPETLWSPWKLSSEELLAGKRDALRLSLDDQLRAGIDIVSDGEQTRQHFVTTFIEHLSGVDFAKREIVKIRNRYEASVPTVVGAVERQKPVFVEDARYLRQLTSQPIKWALPGPMTMIDTLYDNHYKSREKLAWEFAKILNQEAKELEAAGVDIIQFDEPAFNVFFDEVNDWGIAALERATEGLKCETAVHICYGYGIKANTDWKKTLGSEWRQYEEAFPQLQKSSLDIISLECHNSRVPMDLLELIRGKKVMVGAIDVASHAIETPEEVAGTLRKALAFVDADKLRYGAAAAPCRDRQTARPERRRRDYSSRAGGKVRRGAPVIFPRRFTLSSVHFQSGLLPALRHVAASGRQIARRATALHSGNSASRSQG